MILQILGFVVGIVSIILWLVGLIPLLGWLNWLNIPFAGAGFILSLLGTARTRRFRLFGFIGMACCGVAVFFGTLRLAAGCGII